jgi:TonB family protein
VLKKLILSVIIGALPATVFAQRAPLETLKRDGNWVVDYDRDACHLIAQFGTGKDMIIMRLTRYELGDPFYLNLYGRRLWNNNPRTEATVDFGLRETPVETEAVNGTAGDLPMTMLGWMRLDGWEGAKPEDVAPRVHPAQEAAVSGVVVRIRREKPFRLEFGSLAKPMEQLRACQADLLKSWGYDPAVQATLSKPVRAASSGAWLRSTDYPSEALITGQNGVVQFRLDVEADGRIAGCHVLARTSPDVFADTTCRAISRRAKLEPALDAAGKPVRSYYVRRVRWQASPY